MALTAKQAIAHIEHTLYGARSGVDPMDVVNTAGKLLYSMRPWNFRKKGPATLTLTASQSYIELPANFGELDYIQATEALTNRVFRVTLGELLEYRLLSQGSPRDFWVAVAFEIPSGGTRIAPRLEVYPTPETTQAGAFTYLYKSQWVDVSDDDADLTGVPEGPFEPLYLRLCRQVARSYEDEDVVGYTDALGSILSSMEYRASVSIDVQRQGSYGILANGVGRRGPYLRSSYWDNPVNAPS